MSVSACGPIEVELYKCFCIIVNSCIFVQVSPILSFDFAANKFIRNEPSLFPSLLILVQHGWYLSLHGVSSPVIGTSSPERPGQARSTASEPELVGGS